jgi:carbonic anhydrase
LRSDLAALAKTAVRVNIRASVDHLRHGSPLLEKLIQDEGLRVVGAEYCLETGVVEFFEEPQVSPASRARSASSRP